jgi:hypothetical protein
LNSKNDRPTTGRFYLPLFGIAAIVLILIGGYLLYRQNLFTLTGADGRSLCRVEVGWTQRGVATHCGPPTGKGMQPKVPASRSGFFNLQVCSAPGDVYRDKVVLYACDGRVASVEHMPAKGFLEDP